MFHHLLKWLYFSLYFHLYLFPFSKLRTFSPFCLLNHWQKIKAWYEYILKFYKINIQCGNIDAHLLSHINQLPMKTGFSPQKNVFSGNIFPAAFTANGKWNLLISAHLDFICSYLDWCNSCQSRPAFLLYPKRKTEYPAICPHKADKESWHNILGVLLP